MDNNFNNILFLTSFCFMACDGTIANKEIELLKKLSTQDKLFGDIDIDEELKECTQLLTNMGNSFIYSYLEALASTEFTKDQEVSLLKVAVDTIYADEVVEYSEIKFFKAVRRHLNISDDDILENITGVEEFWLEKDLNGVNADDIYLQSIDLSSFTIETVPTSTDNNNESNNR